MRKQNRGPILHISKRSALHWYQAWGIRAAAIVLALIVCAVVTTALTGENPIGVYKTMFAGAFGTKRKAWILGQNLAILLCVSLAVTPAFKMRFWNVGGEGQILAGGLATAACMILLGDKVPNWLLIVLMVISSIAAGAIWGGIPAICKAKWNTNETLFTLMMNYVATQLVRHPLGGAQGRGQNRHHQSEYPGRLAASNRLLQVSAEYSDRSRADPSHVFLPEALQAGL